MRLAPLVLLAAACTADPVLLQVPVRVAPAADTFTVGEVDIHLDQASAVLGDLRMERPEDDTARLIAPWLPTPAARAHPGHDEAGGVAGELVGSWTVDLLAGADLDTASLYDGPYATARITLPADGEVVLIGTATVRSVPRAFELRVTPDQEITGMPFAVTVDAEAPPAGLQVSADLAHALSFIDWSTPDDDDDDTLTTADGALANTALFGVVSTPTWTLSLEP